ncbi:MAG TPA: hypothetical protein VGP26_04760 [Actinophytocola sp.]|jgi:hypothetical protein|nr:hypothetical protein [Actinophytocola sp.]
MSTDAQRPLESRQQTPVHPYSQGQRAFYGSTWTLWTILLFVGGMTLFGQELIWQGLIALALCGLTVRYAYRIWTWQARRLFFLIVF